MELVRIPAGEFLMGSDPQKDKDARDDEKPQHRVFLPDFYIGKVPVTNEPVRGLCPGRQTPAANPLEQRADTEWPRRPIR